jgi:hypothetical protein
VVLNLFEIIALLLLSGIYTSVMLLLFRHHKSSSEGREQIIAPTFIFSLIMFLVAVLATYFLLDLAPNITDFITIFGLVLVGVYVITIEVPGFLMISRYDEVSVDLLEDVHQNLVLSVSSFEPAIPTLEKLIEQNKDRFTELHVNQNLDYFISSSKEMNPQINKSVFDLLLFEISQTTKETADSSKHPFPKLVDVLSLAGLSFLIAQLLK